MSIGFLGGGHVTARGLALSFRRASMGGDVTEALLHREFLNFGRAFVRGAGLIVALQLAAARRLVTLMRARSVLSGTLHIFLRDGLPGGKFCLPAQQLLGALSGFIACRVGHELTLRSRSISGVS